MGTEVNVPPGEYVIVTGVGLSSEDAARGIFPEDADVVLVDTETSGRLVRYTYLIDYREAER